MNDNQIFHGSPLPMERPFAPLSPAPRMTTKSCRSCVPTLHTALVIALVCTIFFTITFTLHYPGLQAHMLYDSYVFFASKEAILDHDGLMGAIRILPERPFLMASLYANYLLSGMEPFSYRATSIFILALAGLALTFLILSILRTQAPGSRNLSTMECATAYAAGLLFVIHPLQVYVTLYVWQRGAILASLFYFLTLAAYIAVRLGRLPKVIGYFSVMTLLLIGMLSKENLITVPLVMILAEITLFGQRSRPMLHRFLSVAALSLPAVAVYFLCVHFLHGADSAVTQGAAARFLGDLEVSKLSVFHLLLSACRMPFHYLAMSLAPGLVPVQLLQATEVSRSLLDPPTTAICCGALFLIVAGAVLLVRKAPVVSFGLLFYLITLAPESILSPQYLFFGYRAILPMAGLLLLLVVGARKLHEALAGHASNKALRMLPVIGIAAICVWWAAVTAGKSERWDRLVFWSDTYRGLPSYSSKLESHSYFQIVHNYANALAANKDCPGLIRLLTHWNSPQEATQRINTGSPTGASVSRDSLLRASRTLKRISAMHAILKAKFLVMLGSCASGNDPADTAADLFLSAMEMDPANYRLANTLGRKLLNLGYAQEAERAFRHAIKLAPDYAPPYTRLGNLLAGKGKFAEAIAVQRRAVRLNPHDARLWNNLGAALVAAKQPEQAVEAFSRAVSLDPALDSAMANYARMLLQLGRKNEAIRTLEASLTPDTYAPRARAWLARTYRGSGQSDRAWEHFQLLVSKDPSEIGFRYELASVLASLSRYQESAIQLEALLARDPNHTMALNDLGAIRLMQGNPEEAVRWLRKAAALQPESDTIQKNLATALKAKHHREKQAGGSRE